MKLCVTWQRCAGQTQTGSWPLKAQAEENVKVFIRKS